MGSANKHRTPTMVNADKHHQPPSKPSQNTLPPLLSENPKNPSTSSDTEERNHPPLSTPLKECEPSEAPLSIDGSQEDTILHRSDFLTREEVLRRRSRRVKQLAKYYRNQYWALTEEVRVKYREYYWKYGKSPFNEVRESNTVQGSGENKGLGFGFGESNCDFNNNNNNCNENGVRRCLFAGCKWKAMALTSYCHPHILSDSKQKLYKACSYVVKSTQTGPVFCGKPVLRAAVPSLCSVHFQYAQKHISRALKKAGFISSPSKYAPKFHVVIAEYVRQIQCKRREVLSATLKNVALEKENIS